MSSYRLILIFFLYLNSTTFFFFCIFFMSCFLSVTSYIFCVDEIVEFLFSIFDTAAGLLEDSSLRNMARNAGMTTASIIQYILKSIDSVVVEPLSEYQSVVESWMSSMNPSKVSNTNILNILEFHHLRFPLVSFLLSSLFPTLHLVFFHVPPFLSYRANVFFLYRPAFFNSFA